MNPKIAVCVAGFHIGNTGEYMIRAFERARCKTTLLNREEFYQALQNSLYDYFLCVDSGETFDFSLLPMKSYKGKLGMWFIDYRHNKDRPERVPTDRQNVIELAKRDAAIFQAQYEDAQEINESGIAQSIWLPVGADPEIWSDTPLAPQKRFDVGFIGNIWDQSRITVLERILRSGITLGFPGHGKVWKENAAAILRDSRVGFNISSFYGTPVAYDLNMRFFETLSCGIPIVTNWVPTLGRLFGKLPNFIRVYKTLEEIVPTLKQALSDRDFLASGPEGRSWLISNGTYDQQIQKILGQI